LQLLVVKALEMGKWHVWGIAPFCRLNGSNPLTPGHSLSLNPPSQYERVD